MTSEREVQHLYLHFGARQKLDFQRSKKFSSEISLQKMSRAYMRNLVAQIVPKGAEEHWLAPDKTKDIQCLHLRKEPPQALDENPSFFNSHLSQQQSSIPDDLAACITAMDLAQPLFYISDFMVGYHTTLSGLRLHQYSGQAFRTSTAMWTAVYEADGNFLTEEVWNKAKEICAGIKAISRISHPRLHQAIRFHARAMREDFFDYCYLNEFLVLESLFNASPQEITHKMAERASIIEGEDDPLETYRDIKNISGFRNQVAHGFRKAKSTRAGASAMLRTLGEKNRVLLSKILVDANLRDVWATSKDNELEDRLLELTFRR